MAENRATKQLKSCDTEGRAASKRSRAQDDKEEPNIEFPATKLQRLQQQQQEQPAGPYLDPDSDVGSSSTSTYEGSARSSSNKFHVFISHRGPDTKQTLAYHMYDLLRVHGIPVFLDKEELESGERFPQAIEEAIACSKVHVCILSTGYAQSLWCLKELEMMVRKYDATQSKLIPVFYDVEPSDVRHLKGAFGQGFQKLETRNPSKDTEAWRKALCTIADISGYQGKGECCRNIVNKILEELDIKLLNVPISMVGRKKQLLSIKDDIMRCRQNGLGVISVQISGMGGIGKTTFAKELYNQFCSQYERSCFIENVRGLVDSHGINEVHKQLSIQLFKYNQSHLTKEGTQLLRERLNNAEVLVVLDNIDSKIQLSMVFIEDHVSLNPRSIIIVTSREEGVLNRDSKIANFCKNLISLDMLKLDFGKSKKLFCEYAFGGIENVRNEFNELIEKIVKKCDGIPLALTLLGRQVYGTDIKFWKKLWNAIEDSLQGDLKKVLQLSYDNLDSELEKCLFLDVATFFLREKQELLVQLRGHDERGELAVLHALEILKRKRLIQTGCNGFLNMHDLLVELGRSIVKDEDPLCPGRRSRVWHPSDVRYVLSEERGTEKIKALTVVSNGLAVLDEDGCPWSTEAFNKLSSLEFLILDGHCIEGSDFSKLSNELRWLKWTNFPYEHMPETLCIKRMRILQLSGDRLTWLWEHHPQEAPTKLRQLSLSNCKNLQSLPEFTGRFRHLSSMILVECTSLKTIPESFGELQGLKYLELNNCKALVRLPEGFGDLKSLRSLKMKFLKRLKSLPESFGNLARLERLDILYSKALQDLPDSFGNLARLSQLDLSCEALQCLPDSFGNLAQLSQLRLQNCKALQRLPDSLGNLAQLKTLKIQECKVLQRLPDSLGNLAQLRTLEILECKVLQRLPDSLGNLAQLRRLEIHECKVLQHLPDSLGNLVQLTILNIQECEALQGLPESFKNLAHLWKLELSRCSSFENLAQLELLKLSPCQISRPSGSASLLSGPARPSGSASLLSGPVIYKSLVHEVTQRITLMKQKRDSVADLLSANSEHTPPQVSDVGVITHHFIQRYQSALHPVYQMSELCLGSLWATPELFDDITRLSSLRRLSLDSCLNLKVLPAHIDNLSHLTKLSLKSLWNLEELPDTIGNLQNLQHLSISDCIVLKGLASQLRSLCRLQFLTVEDCWMVEVLHTQGLISLDQLVVTGCVNMRSIAGLWGLTKLRTIIIEGCLNLTDIVVVADINECASMTSLTNLSISGCHQLLLMHHVVVHLPNLTHLRLTLNDHFLSESLEHDTKTSIPFHLCGDQTLPPSRAALDAKTSPALFWVVEQKARNLLNTIDDCSFSFHKLSPDHDGSSSILFSNDHYNISHDDDITKTVVICSVSNICTVDFPMHIPPPTTTFNLWGFGVYMNVNNRFDFGEEIQMATLLTWKYGHPYRIEVRKQIDSYPSYDASIKDGWMILLRGRAEEQHNKNKLLALEIQNIFYLELMKQRLLSRAWTRLPSQLCIFKFSALDVAGCQITKTSRHCNTCIMEEETGLTFKRRRCLFADDHALLLLQHRRKHSFLAYPGLHLNLEVGLLANLYEMSIYMLEKGNVVDSRKLQEIVPINQEEIPPILNTLFQTRAFPSTLETLHRKRTLGILNRKRTLGTLTSESYTPLSFPGLVL